MRHSNLAGGAVMTPSLNQKGESKDDDCCQGTTSRGEENRGQSRTKGVLHAPLGRSDKRRELVGTSLNKKVGGGYGGEQSNVPFRSLRGSQFQERKKKRANARLFWGLAKLPWRKRTKKKKGICKKQSRGQHLQGKNAGGAERKKQGH